MTLEIADVHCTDQDLIVSLKDSLEGMFRGAKAPGAKQPEPA